MLPADAVTVKGNFALEIYELTCLNAIRNVIYNTKCVAITTLLGRRGLVPVGADQVQPVAAIEPIELPAGLPQEAEIRIRPTPGRRPEQVFCVAALLALVSYLDFRKPPADLTDHR